MHNALTTSLENCNPLAVARVRETLAALRAEHEWPCLATVLDRNPDCDRALMADAFVALAFSGATSLSR